MKKRFVWLICLLAMFCVIPMAQSGMEDRFSGINLTSGNYIELPQIAAPAGNPKNNTGWLYVKDSAGTTKLYFEDDAGSVTDLVSTSATLWSNIGNPAAAKTITFGTYATILTSAKTDGDMFTFRGTGNFGDVSVVKIESITGNPTDGTVLEVVSHDPDADALVVTANSINSLVVAGSGNVNILGGTGTITYTDFTVSTDGVIEITPDLSPAACMTIAPSAAATTGLVVSSANLTNAIDIGAKKILGTTGVIDFTNFDVSGAGAVTCVSLDSGSGTIVTTGAVNSGSLTVTGTANIGIWKQDAVVPAGGAGTTITVNGNGAGGVTIGGTSTGAITLGGGATSVILPAATDLTLSGGTITGTDAGTGPMLSLTNNTLTNSNLVTLSATAMTSGKGVSFTGGAALSGDCFYAQATDAGMTGNYYRAYDAANDVFTVKRYGATTIRGNAATDVLTLTAGNLQVTAGSIDVDNGNLTVDTAQDLASNISRNFAGAGGAALLTVAEQNASSTSTALAVTNAGTAASTGVSIAHSGDNPTLVLTAGAARTGDVINIAMANQLAERAINITGAMTSVAAGGVIEVHATGVIPATASLLRLDADTAQPGDGDGWMLNVDDDTLVVATPKKYAVLINSANNEALHVAAGESLFAEKAYFSAGVSVSGAASTVNHDSNFNAGLCTGTSTGTVSLGGASAFVTFGAPITGASPLAFDGATADASQTTLAVADPTADRTVTLPDYTGGVPLVIGQGATQTSQAGVGTADVTGSSISMAQNWFSAGKTLRYTLTGTKAGANAAMIVHLYLLDAAVMSLTASDGAAGDWTATFVVHEYTDLAKQKITGTLQVNGKVSVVDYAAATKDMAAGATTIKAQIQSQNAGDTVTNEYVNIEHWVK